MIPRTPLAFVDLETTGLSPSSDRITEIGVVTVDEAEVEEWTTFVNPGRKTSEGSRSFNGIADEALAAAPRFKDIAAALARRLAGRLFIAHNARFDFGFLRAEFQRVRIEFQPQVLCSVMLSRKLYSQFSRHDLDSLMERHTLTAECRHRALPDARLLWQFWQVIQKEHPQAHLTTTIEGLLAGPILPVHLDPSLIDRLPELPGVYVLHGDHDTVLHAGKADNLKLHLLNHFRIDRSSRKALEVSHLVRNITWRITRGAIGAHLQLKALSSAIPAVQKRRNARAVYTWRLTPDAYPCVELVRLSERSAAEECYGIFESERKARNALLRVATSRNLCHALLAIGEASATPCTGCTSNDRFNCSVKTNRLKQFTKAVVALAPLRLAKWPYEGPIGVTERSDLHIVDDWRYLGTAQSEHEIHEILETGREDFDEDTFAFLSKTLARLPYKRIVRLDCRLDFGTSPDTPT